MAADADPAENQDPEADGGLNMVQHLLTQRHRRCQSDAAATNEPTEAEKIAQVGATKSACVDAETACVDATGITLTEVAGPG